ncbi:hypothetical protein BDR03DRAFT_228231 [Suillus americanus]|nr:hypothetical protein BDR03DRAFT_228231 [Suillus americanus]
MLRTFTRLFNFNFVLYTLYFISLFNILSWSLHGVQAAPVHLSAGSEEREIGVYPKASGLAPATVAGKNYAFKQYNDLHHVARDSGLDDDVVSASTTSAMPFTSTGTTAVLSGSLPSTLDSSTILTQMFSVSSMSTPWASSSTTSSCTSVVSSSSSQLEAGGSSVGGSGGPASSPIPMGTSPVTPPASSVTASSFPPAVPPSVTTAETEYPLSSPVLGRPSSSMLSASQETSSVTTLSLAPGVPPSVTTVVSDCPSSLPISVPSPATPPASSETPIVTFPLPIVTSLIPPVPPVITSFPPPIPPVITSHLPPVVTPSPSPVVPAASSVTTTSQSAASPATPAGRPTSTVAVSVTPVTPEPSPTTTSTSSTPNAQSNSSSQQASSSPTSSPSVQSDAASSPQLAGSLIAIITVISFLGTFSLILGVIVFFRARRRRITQTQLLEEERQPSPPNLSSRFSVSTTGSME